MRMTSRFYYGSLGVLLLVLFGCVFCRANPTQRWNVLFFLVDDLGWRDLSCYGSQFYETPNMDRLAREGMRFTRAYAAHPRCVPSRYAVFTGKFPARARVPGGGGLLKSDFTMAKAFQDAGYRTFFAGKWHLSNKGVFPKDSGFDRNLTGGNAGAVHTHFYPYNLPGRTERQIIRGLEEGRRGEYLTDRLTEETVKFLRQPENRPFFAVLAHYAVHTPLEAKQEYTELYKKKLRTLNFGSVPEFVWEGPGVTKMRQDHPVYAAMIQSVDESLGRLLDTLEELNIAGKTLVVLTSDHGGLSNRGTNRRELATSNYPLRAGKGWLYEGGIRIPTIVRWPGVTAAGSVTGQVITNTDFFPTLLDAARLAARPDAHLDGVSFARVLRGSSEFERGPIYFHSPLGRPTSTGDSNSSALLEGGLKLIDWHEEERTELFDLVNDPGEQDDLSARMPAKTEEMLRKLSSWRIRVKAITK